MVAPLVDFPLIISVHGFARQPADPSNRLRQETPPVATLAPTSAQPSELDQAIYWHPRYWSTISMKYRGEFLGFNQGKRLDGAHASP
jgi:hypothetical protein